MTLTLDDDMAEQLMQMTGEKTPLFAIRHALKDYLAAVRKQKLLALRGIKQLFFCKFPESGFGLL